MVADALTTNLPADALSVGEGRLDAALSSMRATLEVSV